MSPRARAAAGGATAGRAAGGGAAVVAVAPTAAVALAGTVSRDAAGGSVRCPPNLRNNIGVKTMTSAVRKSAKNVRLSMRAKASSSTATGQGHTRPGGMGDSARCAETPATHRARRHASRWLRSRMRSNSENNDMTRAEADRGSPGSHERQGYRAYAPSRSTCQSRAKRHLNSSLTEAAATEACRIQCVVLPSMPRTRLAARA